jgi:hypothetical protein
LFTTLLWTPAVHTECSCWVKGQQAGRAAPPCAFPGLAEHFSAPTVLTLMPQENWRGSFLRVVLQQHRNYSQLFYETSHFIWKCFGSTDFTIKRRGRVTPSLHSFWELGGTSFTLWQTPDWRMANGAFIGARQITFGVCPDSELSAALLSRALQGAGQLLKENRQESLAPTLFLDTSGIRDWGLLPFLLGFSFLVLKKKRNKTKQKKRSKKTLKLYFYMAWDLNAIFWWTDFTSASGYPGTSCISFYRTVLYFHFLTTIPLKPCASKEQRTS